MGKEWDFFFQPAYQSTDETDTAPVLDPDSDEEHIVPVPATKKAWISRTPEYRASEV